MKTQEEIDLEAADKYWLACPLTYTPHWADELRGAFLAGIAHARATPHAEGVTILFGPPSGHKIDPRFPMPVSVQSGNETVHYISRQESQSSLDKLTSERDEERRLHKLYEETAEAFAEKLVDKEATIKELRALLGEAEGFAMLVNEQSPGDNVDKFFVVQDCARILLAKLRAAGEGKGGEDA